MKQRSPKAFVGRLHPLKIGIHLDILEDAEFREVHRIDEHHIHFALHCRVRGPVLQACEEGAPRIDLAGNPVGVVTAREAEYAKFLLAALQRRRAAAKITEAE